MSSNDLKRKPYWLDNNDVLENINILADHIHDMNREKGFYDDEITYDGNDPVIKSDTELLRRIYLGNKIMLMVGELSETHEAIRKNINVSEHIPEFSGIEEEMADTIIRILDFCGYQNLRLGEALKAKLEFNATRPYKHGKNF